MGDEPKPRPRRRRRQIVVLTLIGLLGLAVWLMRPMLLPPAGEPLAQLPTNVRSITGREGRVSVLLVGDTHFGENYSTPGLTSVIEEHGYDYPLARLRPLLSSADLVVANLETPLTTETRFPIRHVKNWTHWAAPDLTASTLKRAGVDAVSLANDHAFDALGAGLDQTRAVLEAHGIASFGGGRTLAEAARPVRFDLRAGGQVVRLAVIGAFERRWLDFLVGPYATGNGSGAFPLAQRTITGQIQALKAADPELFVVVFPHWGANYEWRSSTQAELGRAMLDAGAQLVVGHGAHLLQEVELRDHRAILYSVGNFMFLSAGRYDSKRAHPWSLAPRLEFFEQDGAVALDLVLYFIASNNRRTGYRPHLLEGKEFEQATKLLFEGGSLEDASRQALRERARRGDDDVGAHLRISLGRIRG